MNFITYGDKKNKSILFIHGLATTADLCFKPLLSYLKEYCVVLCEMDGHCLSKPDNVVSMKESIDTIEDYIVNEMGGSVHGLCGFSMGGTIAVELMGRGNISIDKVLLDAPITVELGLKGIPFTWTFIFGTTFMRLGIPVPEFLLKSIVRRDKKILDIMYPDTTKETIKNVCKYIYHYKVPAGLKNFRNPVMFWRGSKEPIPAESERILKEYLPQMEITVYEDMGHGEFLQEHPYEYSEKLKKFLEK